MGVDDRYSKEKPNKGTPLPGWEGNIMAERADKNGKVEQSNINAVLNQVFDDDFYYYYEINKYNPNKFIYETKVDNSDCNE